MYTIGDMFAGVGGIALGFKQAGFGVKWANERDKYACTTYRSNFSDHPLYEEDVKKLKPEDLGEVDVITSGFPCQAFSIAGYRKGFSDPRGELFFDTVRFIDTLRPKAYLIENVRNLTAHDKGKTFNVIKKTLTEDLGYSCKYFLLSAYEHGGVPQSRIRIYIVGFRDEVYNNLPLFEDESKCKCTSAFIEPDVIPLTKTVRDFILEGKQLDKYYFKEDHKYMPQLLEVMKSRETLYQWRRVYVRENKSGLCPTLTANMGGGGHNVPLLVDGWGFRRLVPRECFNFQGFPDDFVLPENLVDVHLYKQAGNSVTVPVIKRIALAIKDALEVGDA